MTLCHHAHSVYLALVFGVGLTLGVVSPHPVALRVVEPLATRITHFGHLLCGDNVIMDTNGNTVGDLIEVTSGDFRSKIDNEKLRFSLNVISNFLQINVKKKKEKINQNTVHTLDKHDLDQTLESKSTSHIRHPE